MVIAGKKRWFDEDILYHGIIIIIFNYFQNAIISSRGETVRHSSSSILHDNSLSAAIARIQS